MGRGYPYGLDGWFILPLSLWRYESRTTKLPELLFRALVGDDGPRNVRFERAHST